MRLRGDWRKLEQKLRRQGYEVRQGRSHLGVYRDGKRIATMSVSPSCIHAIKQAKRELRRAGVEL